MRKLIAVAILGMVALCPQVRAHDHKMMMPVSGGCSGYSFGQTGWTLLTPSDVAATGGVTATISIEAYDNSNNPLPGALPSHTLTVTPGTWVGLTWSSANATYGQAYYTAGTNPTHYPIYTAQNGTIQHWWMPSNVNLGSVFHLFMYAQNQSNGTTTQDVATLTIGSGTGPSIVHQDGIASNNYWRVNPNFYGGDMMHSCQICVQQPSACSGAQHTPYLSGTLTNHTSGEVQTFQRQEAGTTVDENSPISGSAFWYISTVPSTDDTFSIGATGEIFCSAVADDIYDELRSWRIEYVKVVTKDLGHPGRVQPPPPNGDGSTIFDVAVLCDNNSDPPDWQPTVVHSYSGRHTYWYGVTSMFRAPDLAGITWIPLAPFLEQWMGTTTSAADLAKMVLVGGAIPYPGGTGPDFPIPGACTQYPKNVIITLGSSDIPWWPFNPN